MLVLFQLMWSFHVVKGELMNLSLVKHVMRIMATNKKGMMRMSLTLRLLMLAVIMMVVMRAMVMMVLMLAAILMLLLASV